MVFYAERFVSKKASKQRPREGRKEGRISSQDNKQYLTGTFTSASTLIPSHPIPSPDAEHQYDIINKVCRPNPQSLRAVSDKKL